MNSPRILACLVVAISAVSGVILLGRSRRSSTAKRSDMKRSRPVLLPAVAPAHRDARAQTCRRYKRAMEILRQEERRQRPEEQRN